MKRRSFFKWLAAPFAGVALLKASNVAEAMPAIPKETQEEAPEEVHDRVLFDMGAPFCCYVNGMLLRPGDGNDYIDVYRGVEFERKLKSGTVICYTDHKTILWATLGRDYAAGERVPFDLFTRR